MPDSRTTLHRVDDRSAGYRRIRRGRGFEYRDPRGERISDDIEVSRLRALAIPPAWRDVWICPDPAGHLQATGVDDAGRTQYLYHPEWRRRASKAKFDRMLELAATLPVARRSVTRDLRRPGLARATVLAAGFRILDTGLLRIGSEQYAQAHGTTGLTTLRVSHAHCSDATITLRFRGKSGVPWETVIEDVDLARVVGELCQRTRTSRLLAWRSERGQWHPVRAAEINEDVRERTGGAFTAKDFRTLHGTVIAAASLARTGVGETPQQRGRAVTQAIAETAAALGNTTTVARNSYIDPRLFVRYEEGRTVATTDRSIEAQLVDLLP